MKQITPTQSDVLVSTLENLRNIDFGALRQTIGSDELAAVDVKICDSGCIKTAAYN